MPESRPSDIEVLATTAEWLSRLADIIEKVTDRMADRMAEIQRRQDAQDDALMALSNRIESAFRASATIHPPEQR